MTSVLSQTPKAKGSKVPGKRGRDTQLRKSKVVLYFLFMQIIMRTRTVSQVNSHWLVVQHALMSEARRVGMTNRNPENCETFLRWADGSEEILSPLNAHCLL